MLLKLLVLFIVLPLLDLWLLFTLADGVLSFGATVGLVLATGVIGASLAKQQGLATWRTFNEELVRGALPADTMLDGVLILLAGTVLITPGLITDAVGLALLVPPVRRLVRKFLVQRLTSRIKFHTVYSPHAAGNPARGFAADDATVIDAEFQRRDTNGASSSDRTGS
jgi:UPF0716 protein FxsA